jgi:hypothetical protein
VTGIPRGGKAAARRVRVAVAVCALLVAAQARPQAPSSSTLPPEPVRDPALAGRSVLFDARGAADARVRQSPQYVESIVVEGRDPDGRRPKARPLEQRFADALLAPPVDGPAGMRRLDTTPCMSLQSTWNTFGSSFAPLTGCP